MENTGRLLQTSVNLDPLGFHNLFMVCWITLVDRFCLNLLEGVSVFVAVLLCPNTLEPFARVTLELLQGCRSRSRVRLWA
jgi:hypothetical protein